MKLSLKLVTFLSESVVNQSFFYILYCDFFHSKFMKSILSFRNFSHKIYIAMARKILVKIIDYEMGLF